VPGISYYIYSIFKIKEILTVLNEVVFESCYLREVRRMSGS